MPNECDYSMKIKGSKSAIKRVIDCLKADYNYYAGKPAHKHFFRVFEAIDDTPMEKNEDGTYTQYVWGVCAWSVHSCMCRGAHTYYNDCKSSHSDIFMGTSLAEESRDCEIEVFSEEPGMGFSEHYIFRNGMKVFEDCIDIEIEDDGDDYIIHNPHMVGDCYNWTI